MKSAIDMLTIADEKRCCSCDQVKPISEFHNDRTKRDKHASRCKDCARRAAREWKNDNPERKKQRDKQYSDTHPNQKRQASEKWYAANAHIAKQRAKDWGKQHPERCRMWARHWAEHNLETKRSYTRNRRAKRKRNGGTITVKEWQAVLDKYGNKCLVPGCTRTDITMDHIIPLDLGGPHTIDNVQPLCAHHNCQKQNTIVDYRPLYDDDYPKELK